MAKGRGEEGKEWEMLKKAEWKVRSQEREEKGGAEKGKGKREELKERGKGKRSREAVKGTKRDGSKRGCRWEMMGRKGGKWYWRGAGKGLEM